MRIALAQFNPVVGDIAGNTQKILSLARTAITQGASILVTPELALTGYNPEDLLLHPQLYKHCRAALEELSAIDGITLVLGHPLQIGCERFNTATVIRDGHLLGQYHKMILPNDTVFDECRYFTPGVTPLIFEQQGVKIGVLICEDVWALDPASAAADAGADLIVVLNASPFHRNKISARHAAVKLRNEETGLPFIYVNLVGGQDELIFDGASFAMNRLGTIVAQAAAYQEELLLVEFDAGDLAAGNCATLPDSTASVYQALVLSMRDYVGKNGFPGILLGLSGGVDSALTLAIAVDALGADKVHAVMLPFTYTADISIADARDLAARLGVQYDEIAITTLYQNFIDALAPLFATAPIDTTEENLQARIRATLLMALSNKSGKLVLTTGNKSEMATGYCTLYGDMAGGFAVLKDVAKTLVYQLAHWRNRQTDIIPNRILTRAPSAELRPDQTDQDSLPPYAVLDAIIQLYVEENLAPSDIVAQGYTDNDVKQVVQLLKNSEYKRRQAPIGPRITQRSFGKDWRYPVTNRFSEGTLL